MAFMKPELFKGEAYLVDGPMGVDVVPLAVSGDCGEPDDVRVLAVTLADYCENRPERVWSIKRASGWLGRLSAPGYLDCTPWALYATKAEALADLRDEDESENGDCAEHGEPVPCFECQVREENRKRRDAGE